MMEKDKILSLMITPPRKYVNSAKKMHRLQMMILGLLYIIISWNKEFM